MRRKKGYRAGRGSARAKQIQRAEATLGRVVERLDRRGANLDRSPLYRKAVLRLWKSEQKANRAWKRSVKKTWVKRSR